MGVPCYRMRTVGNYTKETNLMVILAIEARDPRLNNGMEGSIARPRRWIKTCPVGSRDAQAFASFCDTMCAAIEGVKHIVGRQRRS